jgi:hypothetical protein
MLGKITMLPEDPRQLLLLNSEADQRTLYSVTVICICQSLKHVQQPLNDLGQAEPLAHATWQPVASLPLGLTCAQGLIPLRTYLPTYQGCESLYLEREGDTQVDRQTDR